MNNQTVLNNFLRGKKGTSHNTRSTGEELFLHGNLIARHSPHPMFVEIEKDTLLRWPTRTTLRRVNELLVLAGRGGNMFRVRNGDLEFLSELATWDKLRQVPSAILSYKNKWCKLHPRWEDNHA